MAARTVRVKSDSTGAASPSVTKAKSPSVTKVKSPSVTKVKSPSVTKVKSPSVTKVKEPSVTKAKEPSATKVKSPSVTKARKSRAKPKEQLALTPIRVHYNVGLGNRITARGDTDPFRWDSGLEAQYAEADVWELQVERVPAGQTFQFKPLINDTTYSVGENFVATGGQTLDIYPAF